MLLKFLTPEALKTHFPLINYQRGHEYFLQKCVQELAISTERRGDTVTAKVQGHRSQPYRIKIQIRGSKYRLTMRSSCSCSLATNCKHIIATLLLALHHPPPISASREPHSPFPHPPQPALDTPVAQWLQRLNQTISQQKSELTVNESYRVHYVLITTHDYPMHVRVQLYLVKRLKFGGRNVPKKFNPTAATHQQPLHPVDQELVIQLEIARKYAHPTGNPETFPLHKALGEKLLTAMLATERCHWLLPTHPPLRLAPTKTAQFDWQSDESGCQEVRMIRPEGCDSILSIDQLWYVDKNQWQLGLLETGLDVQVATLLLSAPKIPPAQAKIVADWWQGQAPLSTMAQPQLFTTTAPERPKPTPCLRLFPMTLQLPGDYKNHWQPVSVIKPLAALSFRYRHRTVSWENPSQTLHHLKNQQLTPLIRHKKQEQQAFKQLMNHHLQLIDDNAALTRLNPACSPFF